MNRTVIYAAVAAIVIGGSAYLYFGQSETPLAGISQAADVSKSEGIENQGIEIKDTDMVHGSKDAPITLVEYASMTCPHCAAFQKEVIPSLNKDYVETGKVKLVFREFPLDAIARMASAVARCLKGDAYFSFVDLLFANQQDWIKRSASGQYTKESILEGLSQIGRQAGMPSDKVAACADDMANLALVDANWKEGQDRYKVNSTPSFFINGTPHGPMVYDDLKKVLDDLIKK